MKARQFAILMVGCTLFVLWLAFFRGPLDPKPANCPAIQQEAAITQRAAEICTTQLVGCSLSYQEVRAVVSEVEAARACK